MLSDFEQQRQARIERNNERLRSLLGDASNHQHQRSKASATTAADAKPRKAAGSDVPREPARRSLRHRGGEPELPASAVLFWCVQCVPTQQARGLPVSASRHTPMVGWGACTNAPHVHCVRMHAQPTRMRRRSALFLEAFKHEHLSRHGLTADTCMPGAPP